MTPRPDPDAVIVSWLTAGPTAMPADVRRAILTSIADRPQAVPGSPVRWLERDPRPRRAGRGRLGLLIPLVALLGMAAAIGAGSELLRHRADPSPSAVPVEGTYTSSRFHYRLDLPGGWTVEPATSEWRIGEPWDRSPGADVFRSPDGGRFTVTADDVVSGLQPADYAEAFVPDRPAWDGRGRACRVGDAGDGPGATTIPLPRPPTWTTTGFPGRGAHVRAACGYVDAVVFHGRYAYVLSLESGPRPGGDLRLFEAITAGMTFLEQPAVATARPPRTPPVTPAPTPTPPFDVDFSSPRYAYTIRHPADWLPLPATETYVDGRPITKAPTADVLDGPQRTQLSVIAFDLDPTTDIDAWLERRARTRHEFPSVCRFGATMIPGSSLGWQATTIAGHEARVRSECAYAEAAIVIGRRVWYVAHHSSTKMGFGDRAALDDFLETMTFDPDAPFADTLPDGFAHSARYGYRIQVPADWDIAPATEDFVAGRSWADGRGADRYLGPDGERFSVAAVDLPPDVSVADWLERFARSRVAIASDGSAHCLFRGARGGGVTIVPTNGSAWAATTVAGRPALVRSECAAIDAAIVIGRRLYLLSHEVRQPSPNGVREAFDRLARTFVLDR